MSRRQTRSTWRKRIRAESTLGAGPAPGFARAPVHMPAAVTVRIGELRLQSFSRSDGLRIADALQQELSSLLTDRGVPEFWLRSQTIERVKLDDVCIRSGARMQILGEQLARALLRAGDKSQHS